jgi:hypothetical protein
MGSAAKPLGNEGVTLRTCLLVIGFAVVGIALLLVSDFEYLRNKVAWLASVLNQIGGLSLVSAATALAWDLVVKRRFTEEIMAKVRLSHDIVGAGLLQVTDSFHGAVEWSSFLSSAKKIDLLFAYASTWRNTHHDELQKLCQRKDVRLRVVLPDLDNEVVLGELTRRFSYNEEHLREKVGEAVEFFSKLRVAGPATVEIWLLPYSPVLTYYRFDDRSVITTYSQQQKRTAIPTFVCSAGGILHAFVQSEFQAMIEGDRPLARKMP